MWLVCVSSSIQAVDVEAVAVTVKELVSYALTLNPNNQSWLITQADIYFGKKMSEKSSFSALMVPDNICYCSQKMFHQFFWLRRITLNRFKQSSVKEWFYLMSGCKVQV